MTQSKKKSTVNVLKEHSVAKVKLYIDYLNTYLGVLCFAVPHVKEIQVYDLFCGEGIYQDGLPGSAVEAAKAINKVVSNTKFNKKLIYIFNDVGKSDIEPDKLKVDRVEQEVGKVLDSKYWRKRSVNYNMVEPKLTDYLAKFDKSRKAMLFIDPHGYKDITPDAIKSFLLSGQVEVMLFVPFDFIYRLARCDKNVPGTEHAKNFITTLFPSGLPQFSSLKQFMKLTKLAFAKYLDSYCEVFYLTTEKHNVYSLFFFSRSRLGWMKFIDSMWKVDPNSGRGHSPERTMPLFDTIEIDDYPQKLFEFIRDRGKVLDGDVVLFGYQNTYSETKTKQVLRELILSGKIRRERILSAKEEPSVFYLPNG